MSRKIRIMRHYSFVEDANRKDPDVKDYFDMSYKAIGSYWKHYGTVYGSGMTRTEENLLMPDIIGMEAADKEFYKGVQSYFREINTKIPADGLELEVGLLDDSKPLSAENMPLRVSDYIRYRHALGHPGTGKNLQEAEMFQHKHFYIDDQTAKTSAATRLNTKEDEAMKCYLRVIASEDKIDQVLTVLGTFPHNLTKDEKILRLKELSSINSEESESANEKSLDKFIRVAGDKNIGTQAEIFDMIRCEILQRVGTRILIKESGDVIGSNLQDAVFWMQDKANSTQVNILRVQHDELARKAKKPVNQED